MTIEELNDKHLELIRNPRGCSLIGKSHIKLSIQFAIEVLESFDEHTQINDKIQELKQYLDESM